MIKEIYALDVKAIAGKKILMNRRDEYRLNLLQRDDDSPVLVLANVTVDDNGCEFLKPVAELDMSAIYKQVFALVTDA